MEGRNDGVRGAGVADGDVGNGSPRSFFPRAYVGIREGAATRRSLYACEYRPSRAINHCHPRARALRYGKRNAKAARRRKKERKRDKSKELIQGVAKRKRKKEEKRRR